MAPQDNRQHERRPPSEARPLRVVSDSDGSPTVGHALAGASHPLGGLPLALTSFVGREREVAEVGRLLFGNRLVTLSGPGGSGKTRLAMAVAREFEGGAWWVWLAPLSDEALVAPTVAAALGLPETPGRSPVESLVDRLGSGKVLLALDNCEHLVGACADLVAALLGSCPGLRVLATSREPLRVEGEIPHPVPPLSLPEADMTGDELLRYESTRLFVERAETAGGGFAPTGTEASAVARICRRLEGMPLAIELAAARKKVLSAEQISDRLDDSFRLLTGGGRTLPDRHKTLRATMDWSFDLLSDEEKIVFRRLAAFSGG
ncbi:MAG: ATP-binding protein, partial [Rubrobacteraceae bacterium]